MGRTLYFASCYGKAAYPSRRLALELIRRVTEYEDVTGKDRSHMEAYTCRYCGQVHVGHSTKRRQQTVKAMRQKVKKENPVPEEDEYAD